MTTPSPSALDLLLAEARKEGYDDAFRYASSAHPKCRTCSAWKRIGRGNDGVCLATQVRTTHDHYCSDHPELTRFGIRTPTP